MGEDLIHLTYHEEGMGSPAVLCEGGIDWRVMEWYGLAMGGAAGNGEDMGNINTVGVDNLTANPIPQVVDFEISWVVSSTNPKSSDITVKVTARQAFPASTHLHIVVYQTKVDWKEEFDLEPGNGQTYVTNVVWDLVLDSMGRELPQLAVGESHTVTANFTAKEEVQYPMKLRVAALVQVMDTKMFLSATTTDKSPLDPNSIPIITDNYMPQASAVDLSSAGARGIQMTLPFRNTTALVYNTAGRVLARQSFTEQKGARVILSLPKARGVLFMKLLGENRESVVVKVPFRE